MQLLNILLEDAELNAVEERAIKKQKVNKRGKESIFKSKIIKDLQMKLIDNKIRQFLLECVLGMHKPLRGFPSRSFLLSWYLVSGINNFIEACFKIQARNSFLLFNPVLLINILEFSIQLVQLFFTVQQIGTKLSNCSNG